MAPRYPSRVLPSVPKTILALVVCLAGWTSASPVLADHPNALWRVVHGLCLRDMRLTGLPAPCLSVNRQDGYAVVPDPQHRTQVLLVPTARILGIESPEIIAPDAVNYWNLAWQARRYFEGRVGRPVPRDQVGLAINSVLSRSQRQLHIHVDCVRPDVRAALRAHDGEIGYAWTVLRTPVAGHRFRVRRLDGADLGDRNPFTLLARGLPGARTRMALHGLAVTGATFPDGSPGFYLLSNRVNPGLGERGFAEIVLDHRCAVLNEP